MSDLFEQGKFYNHGDEDYENIGLQITVFKNSDKNVSYCMEFTHSWSNDEDYNQDDGPEEFTLDFSFTFRTLNIECIERYDVTGMYFYELMDQYPLFEDDILSQRDWFRGLVAFLKNHQKITISSARYLMRRIENNYEPVDRERLLEFDYETLASHNKDLADCVHFKKGCEIRF